MAKRRKKITIGDRIRKTGKTHQQLADAAGISRPYLTQIATGDRVPGVAIVAQLAAVLGCKVADLRPDIAAAAGGAT